MKSPKRKASSRIWRSYENFVKSKLIVSRFTERTIVTLLIGGWSIHQGQSVIQKQRHIISQIPDLQQKQFDRVKKKLGEAPHSGFWAYETFLYTFQPPSSWAGLAIGLRDIHPYVLKIRLLGLIPQLYESEIGNPTHRLSGNLDFAFVIVYLLPLLIIVLCYNLLSYEKENGTLGLLHSQPTPLRVLILLKFLVRFVVVQLFFSGLLAFGVIYTGAEFDTTSLSWQIIIITYSGFWFALSFLVVSFGRFSSLNAAVLSGSWVLFAILIPACLNLYATSRFATAEGIDLTIRQRQEMNSYWDRPKEEAFKLFFKDYPEWRVIPPVTKRFAWKWYYAMHQAGDNSVKGLSNNYFRSLEQRQNWTNQSSKYSPSLSVYTMLTSLANTGLPTQLSYLDNVRHFHEEMKRFFYPLIFNELNFQQDDYARLPRYISRTGMKKVAISCQSMPILIVTVILITIGSCFFPKGSGSQ